MIRFLFFVLCIFFVMSTLIMLTNFK